MEHPNLDQVERDFCSARQAYAQAQQKKKKKLQKKETSAPIPQNHLEYKVSQGGAVRRSTLIETAHPGQAP